MNRRQFLACGLSSAVASAALPWDPFVEWCKHWLGFVRRHATSTLTTFEGILKRAYPPELMERFYERSPLMALMPKAAQ